MDERLRRAAALVYVDDLRAPSCDPEDAHHLVSVLRLRPGEAVVASDGQGAFRCCVMAARPMPRRQGLDLEACGEVVSQAPGRAVTVGFALQKGDRPEWTVQKLTELGVARIVPLLTERTVIRLDEDAARRRGERLRRVAKEAGAQSRRVWLPRVDDPAPLAGRAGEIGGGGGLAFAEPGGSPLSVAAGVDAVFVGPEGGWSETELASAAELVDLGPHVLRSETAALVAGVLLTAAAPPTPSRCATD